MNVKSRYETTPWLDQYLLFHYGSEREQLPFDFGPHQALNFPVRCISQCLDIDSIPKEAQALDLGCAVGRSTFELTRYCKRVVGIDNSQIFIRAAKILQAQGKIEFTLSEEGAQLKKYTAHLPQGINPSRAEFICRDVMELIPTNSEYQIVLAANLICRLPNPRLFLEQVHTFVAPLGQLILTSPYSWLEEFTPRSQWLEGENMLSSLQNILTKHFKLKKAFDMPFLIREHLRKYQWGVAQASIWVKH